ncbi:MAG: phosphate acyltransferase PlsX [Oscillospiraceae bacterium]
MKIIIDAFGGDNAPLAVLQGAQMAVEELGVEIIAVGDETKIAQCVETNNISMDKITVVDAKDVISMCDDPTLAIRNKKESSMVKGLTLLASGEGDAFVSAGSTGALLTGATLLIKRLKGAKRAALGAVVPGGTQPYLLLDCGANVECRADMLVQFAVMGNAYMENVMGIKNPTVGLVNNGTEESKGTQTYVEAHAMLKQSGLNFVGNVEPREVPAGDVNVIIADGFSGNIILKLTEGLAKYFMNELKVVFKRNLLSKLAYLMVKPGLRLFKKKMDSEEAGGAPLLGVTKPVIKAHGSSKAKAFKNAIRQAKICVETDMVGTMAQGLLKAKELTADSEITKE